MKCIRGRSKAEEENRKEKGEQHVVNRVIKKTTPRFDERTPEFTILF